MPLQNDELSIWEVAFRWGGYDPERLWFQIPLAVRDNIRLIVNAIYLSELECWELSYVEKHPDTGVPSPRYIGNYINDVTDCIEGKRYKQAFLRKIHLDRPKVYAWCMQAGLRFPEFWQAQQDEGQTLVNPAPPPSTEAPNTAPSKPRKPRANPHKDHMRELAAEAWEQAPLLKIIEVANRIDKENMRHPKPVTFKVLQEWIADLDPRPPGKRRGRKKNNSSL